MKGEQMITHSSHAVDAMHGLEVTPASQRDELGDEHLIQALADGRTWAMELLYQRYNGPLYSLAYRIVADRQVAEELLQEVFLATWRHAASYTPASGNVRRWLMSITHHRAIDYLRHRRRHPLKEVALEGIEQDESIAYPDVWDDVWHSTQISMVRECMMELLPEQRLVIELAYFQGWTQSEIAKANQVPLGTVKARIRLGLQHLRRELEKRGIG